jgi:hypothetical protein
VCHAETIKSDSATEKRRGDGVNKGSTVKPACSFFGREIQWDSLNAQ